MNEDALALHPQAPGTVPVRFEYRTCTVKVPYRCRFLNIPWVCPGQKEIIPNLIALHQLACIMIQSKQRVGRMPCSHTRGFAMKPMR